MTIPAQGSVGIYSATTHRKLEESYENNEPMLPNGCEVKTSGQRDELEILVKTGTEISNHKNLLRLLR